MQYALLINSVLWCLSVFLIVLTGGIVLFYFSWLPFVGAWTLFGVLTISEIILGALA